MKSPTKTKTKICARARFSARARFAARAFTFNVDSIDQVFPPLAGPSTGNSGGWSTPVRLQTSELSLCTKASFLFHLRKLFLTTKLSRFIAAQAVAVPSSNGPAFSSVSREAELILWLSSPSYATRAARRCTVAAVHRPSRLSNFEFCQILFCVLLRSH